MNIWSTLKIELPGSRPGCREDMKLVGVHI